MKVVFATETLALGINMPARSVVIEELTKFGGRGHQELTPGEYTQLTGRAGRRGIDEVGYAAVLCSPFHTFGDVARIAGGRPRALSSLVPAHLQPGRQPRPPPQPRVRLRASSAPRSPSS